MNAETIVTSANKSYYRKYPAHVESYRQEVENKLQDALVDLQLATGQLNRTLQMHIETYEDYLIISGEKLACEAEIHLQEGLISQTIKNLWESPEISFKITIENYRVMVEASVPED